MYKKISCSVMLIVYCAFPLVSEDFFSGTWCVGRERLVISFLGDDSLRVSSSRDETINGKGTYKKNDTLLIATIINEDLALTMGYRYRQKNENTIKAKLIFFTIDGDSVDHPRRWMRMVRCDPKSFSFEEEEIKEKAEEDSSSSQ